MPVEQQDMAIYAVTNGHIDDIPVDQVREWEHGFHNFMRTQHPDIGNAIRTSKVISKEDEPKLVEAIKAFKETFAAQKGAPAKPAFD